MIQLMLELKLNQRSSQLADRLERAFYPMGRRRQTYSRDEVINEIRRFRRIV